MTTTTLSSLAGLGHEQLVSLVRGTVTTARPAARPTNEGLYRRDPRVPAVRIETYPRRRRVRAAAVSLAAPVAATVSRIGQTPPVDEPSYADFFAPVHAHAMSA